MGYRGEDLDLRTPQTWSTVSYAGSRGTPIWVDDVVLECANHAFDVALAHRSGEVRLEHLLHALTLVGAAIESLEARGIRTAGLRRDTGTVIASEIPVGLQNGKGVPHRSELFEDVLRLAADHAGRRNAPATVDDILHILIDVKPDLPGAALLYRHAAQPPREIGTALPPLGRTSYAPAPRITEQHAARERIRFHVGEAAPSSVRADLGATATDSMQNSRLDTLEQMVRTLGSDLTHERKVFSGVLHELQRDLIARREDIGRHGASPEDRFQALEHIVTTPRSDGNASPAILERLQNFEFTVEQRLEELSRTWSHLSDRLIGLEQAVRESRGGAPADLKSLEERMTALERAIQAALANRAAPVVDMAPVINRLDIIEEALLSGDVQGGHPAGDRLRAIEEALAAERAEASAANAVLKSDIKALTGALVSGPLVAQMTGFSTSLENRQAETSRGLGLIGERISGIENAVAGVLSKVAAIPGAPDHQLDDLREQQTSLIGAIDQLRLDAAGDIGVLGNRIESLEEAAARPVAMLEQLTATVNAMHAVTVARYHRRHQFWYWLFGTDDWVAASWRSQASLIEQEQSMLNSLRKQYRSATKNS